MNFQEAENYLFSLGNEVETMKLGLENITALLEALGRPHQRYTKVQVAGTNGKGSVCAFLNSICLEAGIRTGVYTSPHLVSIRERIQIDGNDISEEDFAGFASQIKETAESLVAAGRLDRLPTFFEQVTAIALTAFAEAKVELAILETGLGGRFDATTAANAEIAAITRIDLDHQEYLGDTIEEIAAEKAAIIREGSTTAVVGRQVKEAERVILGRCREVGVTPVRATSDITTQLNGEPGWPIYTHTFRTERAIYPRIDVGLLGRHQAENAAVALAVVEILQDKGFKISESEIYFGLTTAVHPGRLESIGEFLLDGAHNASGAKALSDFLDDFVPSPITLIFGAMREKDVEGIVRILFPKAEHIVLTQPENSRAMSVVRLSELANDFADSSRIVLTETVSDAVRQARERTPAGGRVVVTGSLYLVGEVKKLLTEKELRSRI